MRKTALAVLRFVQDCIEIYIPSALFFIMFITFCIQIFTRYFFDFQYEWTYEFTVLGYMWTSILAACYAGRVRDHVSFTLLYDKLSPKGQLACTILGNLIMVVAFGLMFGPCMEYINFMAIKTTPILKLTFQTAYFPFMVFLLFSTLYLVRDTIRAVLLFAGPAPEETSAKEGAAL